MTSEMNNPLLQRSLGRRKEDRLVRDLLRVGQIITSEIDMEVLFTTIMEETRHIMDVEYCAIFVHNERDGQLWTFHPSGPGNNRASVPADSGIAGWVFTRKEPLIVNDVQSEERFCREVDNMPALDARNVLSVPLVNRAKECIGVYQAVNKMTPEGLHADFTDLDLDLFASLSSFVVIATENSRLYEEIRLLDKTKERVIHHISHEMKTPLTILSVTLNKTAAKLCEGNVETLARLLEMGKRNMNRLLQLQEKIDDILRFKTFDHEVLMMNVIEDAYSLVEIIREQQGDHTEVLTHIARHIESFYRVSEIRPEEIFVHDFLHEVIDETMDKAGERTLEIVTDIEGRGTLYLDREIFRKICMGILKNAVENTPDEGVIEVRSRLTHHGLMVEFQDYGVGITDENQGVIFGGFFHTQDTPSYSSKQPYEFNAGGSGADLLRMKVFSERLGFSIALRSTRCRNIPNDADACPGLVSACPHYDGPGRDGCLHSGGSTFTLRFPPKFVVA